MDIKLLNEAFQSFTKASKSLESYYAELQERIQYLTGELERKNQALRDALQEVQKSRDFLDAIIRSMEEAIIVIDPEERIIMMNHTAEELFGVRAEDFYERPLSDIDFTISHDGADAVLTAGGKKRKIILSNAPVLRNGGLSGEVILIKDITALREMELQQERNKRLIAMGEMAAQIVHEIRNPLCSIELFTTMLEKEVQTEKGKELSKGISAGIRTLNNILTNMLLFARPGRTNLRPVMSSEIIRGVLQMLGPILNSNRVKIHCSEEDHLFMADRELLIQAILNIMINAIQAMPDGGDIFINIYENNGFKNLSIKDTGRGIEQEIIDRIFDPFFTTKENGTGLGLAITAKIIQAHGGLIRVESAPGRGSEFVISIPSLYPSEKELLHETGETHE